MMQSNLPPNSAHRSDGNEGFSPSLLHPIAHRPMHAHRMPLQRIEHGYGAIPDAGRRTSGAMVWWLDEWRPKHIVHIAYDEGLNLQVQVSAARRADEVHSNLHKPAQGSPGAVGRGARKSRWRWLNNCFSVCDFAPRKRKLR
jgi:hypothetical protein